MCVRARMCVTQVCAGMFMRAYVRAHVQMHVLAHTHVRHGTCTDNNDGSNNKVMVAITSLQV